MTEFTTWRSLVDGEEISAILGSVVDNFEPILYEDEGLTLSDYYQQDTGDMARVDDETFDSTKALELPEIGSRAHIRSIDGDQNEDLPRYFKKGEKLSARLRFEGSDLDGARYSLGYGQDESMDDQQDGFIAYLVSGDLEIRKDGDTLDNTSFTPTAGDEMELEIEWKENDEHVVTVYDLDDDGNRDGELAFVSTTDGDYSNNTGVSHGQSHDVVSGESGVDRTLVLDVNIIE